MVLVVMLVVVASASSLGTSSVQEFLEISETFAFALFFECLEQQKLYCHKDVVDQMSQKLCICNGLEPIELKQNCSCTVWSF